MAQHSVTGALALPRIFLLGLGRTIGRPGLVIIGSTIVAGSIVGSIVVNRPVPPVTTTLLANIFTAPDVPAPPPQATPSCTRSAALISYAQALPTGHVCARSSSGATGNSGFAAGTVIENACYGATGGDIIGMKDGIYSRNTANGMVMETAHDCSDNTGADMNPNCGPSEQNNFASCGSLTNWVTYKCADTDCATIDPATNQFHLSWQVGGMIFARGNYHARFVGVPFNTGVKTNYGGESTGQQAANLRFEGLSPTQKSQFFGIQVIGSKDILLKNLNYGPTLQCSAQGPNSALAFECDPNGPWFESQFAFVGTNQPGCNPINTPLCGGFFVNGGSEWTEPYVHDGGAGAYKDIRFQDVDMHDITGKQDGSGIHPGCIFTFDAGNSTSTPSHNMVWDHVNCERTGGAVIQLADSGVTIQNSTFACMARSPQNTGGPWDQCANGAIIGVACKPMGLTTGLGSNRDVQYTRANGNTFFDITIAHVVSGVNTLLSVSVAGHAVTVNLATDASGNPSSTANQVIAAVNGNGLATALLTAAVRPSTNGTGLAAAMTPQGVTCNIPTNDLFRFNTIIAGNANPGTGWVFQNSGVLGCCGGQIRVIGNLVATGVTCGGAGVTYANNAYVSTVATCGGTGDFQLLAGDPFFNSSTQTSNGLYSLTGSVTDLRLDGTPNVTTFNASSLGTDYALDHDARGVTRDITQMRYGAYN